MFGKMRLFLNASTINIQFFGKKNQKIRKNTLKILGIRVTRWLMESVGDIGIMGDMGQMGTGCLERFRKVRIFALANREIMVCRESAFSLYSDGVKLDTSPKYIKE